MALAKETKFVTGFKAQLGLWVAPCVLTLARVRWLFLIQDGCGGVGKSPDSFCISHVCVQMLVLDFMVTTLWLPRPKIKSKRLKSSIEVVSVGVLFRLDSPRLWLEWVENG